MRQLILLLVLLALGPGNESQGADQPPQNIILMIADGCGFNHVDAASLYQHGKVGDQVYEKFPVQIAMSNACADGQPYDPEATWASFDHRMQFPTDSAAAITAMGTGVRTRNLALGVDPGGAPLTSVVHLMEERGKATGVVTSVEFSHATPAGLLVRHADRYDYRPIARAMVLESRSEVIMGAGHPYYDAAGDPSPEPLFDYVGGPDVWEALLAGQAGSDAAAEIESCHPDRGYGVRKRRSERESA